MKQFSYSVDNVLVPQHLTALKVKELPCQWNLNIFMH